MFVSHNVYKSHLQQDRCLNFADKYIEFDHVILFLDMVLHKPQVYRHLLFNRLKYTEHGMEVFDGSKDRVVF